MAKPLSDILKGVKKSTVTPGSTGKDPGVDYMPKAGDEQKFVAKHSTEKHDHRTGNGPEVFSASQVKHSMDDPRMKNFGHKKSDEKKVYEAKEDDEKNAPFSGPFDKDQKAKDKNVAKNAARKSMKDMKGPKKMEEAKCNMTEAGKMCPVHGMAECYDMKTIKEVEQVDEVLTKSTTAGETIHDFMHSKNPKFAGKSKEKRKQMALAAYYAKQRGVKEDLAMPMVGSTDIAKHKTDDTQDEIDMVRTELRALANKAMHMLAAMPKDVHVEPWVQAKIAQAKEMIGSVHDYVVYGNHENEDMADNTGGGAGSAGGSLVMNQMDTPMTFPNMSVDVNTGQNV